ncbi:MAG: LysR substrate-binding domain-containing protein [Variovorax sp.]
MEFDQLKAFITVAETGTFSRAAILLATAQPILSRKVKMLEEELGAELFHRTGRGVVLSEAGKLLEQYARGLLDTAASAKTAIETLGVSPVGHVTIGMPSSIAMVLAVELVQDFRLAFPNVSLKVMEGYSGHVLEWLAAGRLDIAVLYDSPSLRGSSLETDPLLSDELFLIGSPRDPARVGNGPVRVARLADIPLVLPSRPHGVRVLVDDAMARAGGGVANVQMEIDALHSMMALAENGVGYSVMSYSAVRELIHAQRLRIWRIVDPTITRSLVIATATQRPSTKPARALTRLFKEKIESHVRDGRWAPPGMATAATVDATARPFVGRRDLKPA